MTFSIKWRFRAEEVYERNEKTIVERRYQVLSVGGQTPVRFKQVCRMEPMKSTLRTMGPRCAGSLGGRIMTPDLERVKKYDVL